MVQFSISHFIFGVLSLNNHQKVAKIIDYRNKVEKCNTQQKSISRTT